MFESGFANPFMVSILVGSSDSAASDSAASDSAASDSAASDTAASDTAAEFDPEAFAAWLAECGVEIPDEAPEPDWTNDFYDHLYGHSITAREQLDGCLSYGPGVSAMSTLARLDPSSLSMGEQIDLVVVIEQQKAWLEALQLRALALIDAADASDEGWSRDVLSCALRLPTMTTQRRLATARTLTGSLSRTMTALSKGQISLKHAEIISEATWNVETDVAADLEAAVINNAADQTAASLRLAVRRAMLRIDPATAEDRRQRALKGRTVQRFCLDDGMAELRLTTDAVSVQAIFTRLDAAAQLLPASDDRSIDHKRADLLVDGVLNGIPHDALPELQGRRPTVQVVVSAATLMGLDDEPGDLAGYGAITAEAARRAASDDSGTWRRIVTDPTTGHLLDYGTQVYRPPRNLAEFVMTRDGVCIFPTCNQPAYRCDLEHCMPFDRGGPTCPGNTAVVCRRHHNGKTHGPFRYRMNSDGGFTWTDDTGHDYTSRPPRRWTHPDEQRPWVEYPPGAHTETDAERAQREDIEYGNLIQKLERQLIHTEEAQDTCGFYEAQPALAVARDIRVRQLRNREDPDYPPF
jgi:hypothetical protein